MKFVFTYILYIDLVPVCEIIYWFDKVHFLDIEFFKKIIFEPKLILMKISLLKFD